MSIIRDIAKLVEKDKTLLNNRVAHFAYTSECYENDDADGVENFEYSRSQNIPKADVDILQINNSVLEQGYRSQAS